MPVVRQIVDHPDIKPGAPLDICRWRGLVKDLRAQVEPIIDLAPQRRAKEAVVLVAGAWVDPIATAAIGGPGTEILLQPDRQEDLRVPGAEAELLVPDRHQDLRIDRHLREPVVFAWRNETVFRTKLNIVKCEAGVVAFGHGIALWNDRGELKVRQSAIVHFQPRQDAAPAISGSGAQ